MLSSTTRSLTRLTTRQIRNVSQKPGPINAWIISSQLTQQPSLVSEPPNKRYNSTTSLSSPTLPEKEQQEDEHDDSTPGPSRMRIQFKCIAPSSSSTSSLHTPPSDHDPIKQEPTATCGHLNTHEFSSQAFHHGIVLVQCPSCLNRHLIADHLQWFTSNRTSDDPNFKDDHRTIIDLMRAKGEAVKRGRVATSYQLKPKKPNSQSPSGPQSQSHTQNVGEVLEFYQ